MFVAAVDEEGDPYRNQIRSRKKGWNDESIRRR